MTIPVALIGTAVAEYRFKNGVCNMSKGLGSPLQHRLLERIAELEALIAELAAEKAAVERLILHERGKESGPDVPRRNSATRVIVEERVLEILSSRKIPVYGRYILGEIKRIIPDMNPSTFRSHLHRMKEKNIIASANKHGFWTIPDLLPANREVNKSE